jgi:copper chaperone CopZ
VRGMLTKMPGVAGAKVEAQNTDIVVTFDPTITNAQAVIDGLKAGGQPAKKKS